MIISYTAKLPQLNITSQKVQEKTKRLKAQWSVDTVIDFLNIAIEKDLERSVYKSIDEMFMERVNIENIDFNEVSESLINKFPSLKAKKEDILESLLHYNGMLVEDDLYTILLDIGFIQEFEYEWGKCPLDDHDSSNDLSIECNM